MPLAALYLIFPSTTPLCVYTLSESTCEQEYGNPRVHMRTKAWLGHCMEGQEAGQGQSACLVCVSPQVQSPVLQQREGEGREFTLVRGYSEAQPHSYRTALLCALTEREIQIVDSSLLLFSVQE